MQVTSLRRFLSDDVIRYRVMLGCRTVAELLPYVGVPRISWSICPFEPKSTEN